MYDLICRWFGRLRAVSAPGTSGFDPQACRAVQTVKAPASLSVNPAPSAPQLAVPPIESSTHFLWVTAHGIDFRPRQPRGAEVSR
ncbi:hypothetical protein GCM10010319_45800 [Streptomyces blastmyceticus]|uniref:Uncharacterized protein n=1 Tax=Streptomyces blastmyceticus TaxID=68180 RepID=A0ABP3H5V6_9ACTN